LTITTKAYKYYCGRLCWCRNDVYTGIIRGCLGDIVLLQTTNRSGLQGSVTINQSIAKNGKAVISDDNVPNPLISTTVPIPTVTKLKRTKKNTLKAVISKDNGPNPMVSTKNRMAHMVSMTGPFPIVTNPKRAKKKTVLWQVELNAMILQNNLDTVRIEPTEAFPSIIFGERSKMVLNIVTMSFSPNTQKNRREGFYATTAKVLVYNLVWENRKEVKKMLDR
jgi:hypothetical protein